MSWSPCNPCRFSPFSVLRHELNRELESHLALVLSCSTVKHDNASSGHPSDPNVIKPDLQGLLTDFLPSSVSVMRERP